MDNRLSQCHGALTATDPVPAEGPASSGPVHDDEGTDEEVEGDGGVAVASQEGHEAAKAEEDHEFDVKEPLVVLADLVTARAEACATSAARSLRGKPVNLAVTHVF